MTNKKKMIIMLMVLITIIVGNTKIYANTENNITTKEYQTTQNEENKFLNEIYNTETNNLKIINLDKKIAKENYITKEIIETKELNRQDRDYINQEFGEKQSFDDGEYKGELTISDIKVETISNGYYETIDERVLSFNNYSNNDLNNIEKEITLNNIRYYLINVNWEVETTETIDGENVPKTYKGNKVYQTVKKVANPNTYKVTVTYSGTIEKINTIYDYTVKYENKVETKQEQPKENNVIPVVIVSGIGLTIILISICNFRNTYIYCKTNKGFKLIKKARLSNKNVLIDITECRNRGMDNIYAIKINKIAFNKLKGRTISIVLGNKKKDIVIWNDYYEIKL